MKNNTCTPDELIRIAYGHLTKNDYPNAIACLNNIIKEIKIDDRNIDYILDNVLWPLGNLYHAINQYDKALEIENMEYEWLFTRDNSNENFLNLSEALAKKMVKFCLSHGVTYSCLNRSVEAKDIFELGYWIAFHYFGEYDIETLKLAYNIAGIELEHGNTEEGIRQMKYCYYDMREHLDRENEYVIRAETVLKNVLDIDPNQLYEEHFENRIISKKAIDSFIKK